MIAYSGCFLFFLFFALNEQMLNLFMGEISNILNINPWLSAPLYFDCLKLRRKFCISFRPIENQWGIKNRSSTLIQIIEIQICRPCLANVKNNLNEIHVNICWIFPLPELIWFIRILHIWTHTSTYENMHIYTIAIVTRRAKELYHFFVAPIRDCDYHLGFQWRIGGE